MDFSNLHPPNIYGLSDKVIGNLTHPTWEPRDTTHNRAIHSQPRGQHLGAPLLNYTETTSVSADPVIPLQTPQAAAKTPLVTKPWARLATTQRRKSASSLSKAIQSIAMLQASGYELSEQQQRAIMEDVLRKGSRHRYLQASYKRKQNEAIAKAERDNRHLRGAVEELERQVKAARLGTKPKLNHGATARRYQHNFLAYVSDPARQTPSVSAFLLCILASKGTSDTLYGAESVLEDWRLISEHFELSDLRTLTTGILVGTTITSVTISGRTLRLAFPHLSNDGVVGGAWSPLAIKLLGKQLVMQGWTRFHLDHERNRVMWIESEADMLPPMIRILGSLESAYQVLSQALITPEFKFRLKTLNS